MTRSGGRKSIFITGAASGIGAEQPAFSHADVLRLYDVNRQLASPDESDEIAVASQVASAMDARADGTTKR